MHAHRTGEVAHPLIAVRLRGIPGLSLPFQSSLLLCACFGGDGPAEGARHYLRKEGTARESG